MDSSLVIAFLGTVPSKVDHSLIRVWTRTVCLLATPCHLSTSNVFVGTSTTHHVRIIGEYSKEDLK